MTRARARSLWLAAPILVAACSSAAGTQPSTVAATIPAVDTVAPAASVTTAAATTPTSSAGPSTTLAPATTLVPIDPSVLIPIAVGNKAFPADADTLATAHHGYTGDPNATLQVWLVSPMAVPSGPDVRLLGFERTIGINTTTATFLTGAIDPQAALTAIETALAPSSTYTVTPTTRTDGAVTVHGFDAQPNTVQGAPPGWSVEASSTVDQLGVVRIKRSDYTFANVVPTFDDLPPTLQAGVLNQDAIAVNIGGVLTSIAYDFGVASVGDTPARRTRLTYDIASDFAKATNDLAGLLTTGWRQDEQPDALYFTSLTTSEVWTLDDIGGGTHLTYDTGS